MGKALYFNGDFYDGYSILFFHNVLFLKVAILFCFSNAKLMQRSVKACRIIWHNVVNSD